MTTLEEVSRRILITGGTGFVGNHLVDELSADDRWDVTISSRRIPLNPRVRHLKWDLNSEAIPEMDTDVVIHAATPASAELNTKHPQQMFWQNVFSMQRIIKFAESCAHPPTVVFTSSGGVYGEMPPSLDKIPEGYAGAVSTLETRSAYAEGKRAAEYLLTEASSRGVCVGVIARLFAFSGKHLPLDNHFAVGNFVRDALRFDPIRVHGDGSAVRSYLDGADMARWIIALADHGEPGFSYHIGSERAVSIASLAKIVAERAASMLGYNQTVLIEGTTKKTDGVNRYVPETTMTRQALAVTEEVSLEESIDKMLMKIRPELINKP